MHCPACHHPLRRFKAGTVTLDGCDGGCGGIWFDHRELAKVNRQHPDPDAKIADLAFNPKVRVHDDDVRECPKCDGVTLEKKLHCLGSGVIMDVCPECQGLWLDHGELEKIREALHPRPPHPHAAAPKTKPRHIVVNFDVVQQVRDLQARPRS
jgi:Zn-finger nucleic acid-binding protein